MRVLLLPEKKTHIYSYFLGRRLSEISERVNGDNLYTITHVHTKFSHLDQFLR